MTLARTHLLLLGPQTLSLLRSEELGGSSTHLLRGLLGVDYGWQARWPERGSDPGFLKIKGRWELWKWKDPRSLSSLLFAQPASGVFPTHNQFTYSCVLISNYYLLDSVSISTGETQCQTLFQKQGCKEEKSQVLNSVCFKGTSGRSGR